MFNWHDLTYFLELARQERLSPAAKRLRVDHSTVSRRIGELEKTLGTKLFDRTGTGFALTESGAQLMAYAERMEQEAIQIAEDVGSRSGTLTGRVRVASMEGIGAFFLAKRFGELSRTHPGLVVELITERHLINLIRREADISISFEPVVGARVASRRIGSFGLRLYAAPEYLERHGMPTRREELPRHVFVDYVEDLIAIPTVHWLREVLKPRNVSFRSTSLHAQLSAVSVGAGIGLLPFFVAKEHPDLVPVLLDQVEVRREVYLGVHEDLALNSRVRAIASFLETTFINYAEYLNRF